MISHKNHSNDNSFDLHEYFWHDWSASFLLKDFSQYFWKFLCSTWIVLMCWLRFRDSEHDFPHDPYSCLFCSSPSWICFMCSSSFKAFNCLKDFPQESHLKFLWLLHEYCWYDSWAYLFYRMTFHRRHSGILIATALLWFLKSPESAIIQVIIFRRLFCFY